MKTPRPRARQEIDPAGRFFTIAARAVVTRAPAKNIGEKSWKQNHLQTQSCN